MKRRFWPKWGRDRDGPNLDWVDGFIHSVRPYLHVRLRDNLLIKRPNQVSRLNPPGALILAQLLGGTPVRTITRHLDRPKKDELALFLHAISRHVDEGLQPHGGHPAVETLSFSTPFSQWPVLSEIALTYRCNLRCGFCYAGCNCTRGKLHGTDNLDEAGFREILRRIREDAGVPSVSFTGGEPTLVAFLPSLVAHAKTLGMRVNLISNGTLLDAALIRRLVKAGLDSAQISIEGPDADSHDAITGMSGSFERATRAVKLICKHGLHVHTNTTLHQQNLHRVAEMPAMVRQMLGLEHISMNLVIPTGSVTTHRHVMVTYHEAVEPIRQVQHACRVHGVEFHWYSPLPLCLFNTIAEGLGNKGCAACDGLLSIAPNGDVLPCASWDEPVGNLLQQDFDAIWHSTRAVSCRKKQFAHSACKDCSDFALCQGACPLYWKDQGYEELIYLHTQRKPQPCLLHM